MNLCILQRQAIFCWILTYVTSYLTPLNHIAQANASCSLLPCFVLLKTTHFLRITHVTPTLHCLLSALHLLGHTIVPLEEAHEQCKTSLERFLDETEAKRAKIKAFRDSLAQDLTLLRSNLDKVKVDEIIRTSEVQRIISSSFEKVRGNLTLMPVFPMFRGWF